VFTGSRHERVHDEMLARLRALEDDDVGIDARLHELDTEWDLDRAFFLGAGLIVTTFGVAAVARTRRPSPLLAAGPFLLLRALAGWAPPMSILRLFGVRSRQEIEHERTASALRAPQRTRGPRTKRSGSRRRRPDRPPRLAQLISRRGIAHDRNPLVRIDLGIGIDLDDAVRIDGHGVVGKIRPRRSPCHRAVGVELAAVTAAEEPATAHAPVLGHVAQRMCAKGRQGVEPISSSPIARLSRNGDELSDREVGTVSRRNDPTRSAAASGEARGGTGRTRGRHRTLEQLPSIRIEHRGPHGA
jgi:hypothetical protein